MNFLITRFFLLHGLNSSFNCVPPHPQHATSVKAKKDELEALHQGEENKSLLRLNAAYARYRVQQVEQKAQVAQLEGALKGLKLTNQVNARPASANSSQSAGDARVKDSPIKDRASSNRGLSKTVARQLRPRIMRRLHPWQRQIGKLTMELLTEAASKRSATAHMPIIIPCCQSDLVSGKVDEDGKSSEAAQAVLQQLWQMKFKARESAFESYKSNSAGELTWGLSLHATEEMLLCSDDIIFDL